MKHIFYKINLKKHKNFIIPATALFLIIVITTTLTSKKQSHSIKEKKIITTDSENINKEYFTEEGEVDKANENDLNNYADQNDNIKLNEKDMKSKFDQSKNNKKNKYKKKEEDLSVNKTKNKDLEKDLTKAPIGPTETIKILYKGLDKINSNKEDLNSVKDLIDQTYNIQKMSAMIIGKNWKKVDIEQRKIFVNVFKEYIVKTYIKRFSKIKKIDWTINEEKKMNEKFNLVKTTLKINEDDSIMIDYLLSKDNKNWKIFDVLLSNSISEIAVKKSEFNSFINGSELSQLIEAIEKKNLNLID